MRWAPIGHVCAWHTSIIQQSRVIAQHSASHKMAATIDISQVFVASESRSASTLPGIKQEVRALSPYMEVPSPSFPGEMPVFFNSSVGV